MHPQNDIEIGASSIEQKGDHLYLKGKEGPTLQLDTVQPEGKAAMPTKAFLNGWKRGFQLP